MSWFLKQGGDIIYGPHTEETLRAWAADGRIGVEDEVSQDEIAWYPAADLEMLELNWLVRLRDDSVYGPVHAKALRVLARNGQADADAEVANWRTGQTARLWEALAGTPDEGGPDRGEVSLRLQAAIAALTASREYHAREARKWKERLEEERRLATGREEELARQAEDLRKGESDLRGRLEQAERRADRLSEDLQKIRQDFEQAAATEAEKRAVTWMSSYQEVSLRAVELAGQLEARARENEEVRAAGARAEEEARKRILQIETALEAEKRETEQVRQRLAEVEQSHGKLVSAYRELTERKPRPAAPPAAFPPERPGA